MKRYVEFFDGNYENDTAVVFVDTGRYSMMDISVTSEDEDAGTETIHSDPAVPPQTREQMAYTMLQELTKYMDLSDEGRYDEIDRVLRMKYSEYMVSTLVCAERALQQMTEDYKPNM